MGDRDCLEAVDFDVEVTYTMTKKTMVSDDEYIVNEEVEHEYDGETTCAFGYRYYDTSNCDFTEDYKVQHQSPIELLLEYKSILQHELDELKKQIASTGNFSLRRKVEELERKIDDCGDWELDEVYAEGA